MSDQPYLSIATATFMSEADFEAFRAKATTFSSEKALAYLKENGQTNFSIIPVSYTHLTLPTILLV